MKRDGRMTNASSSNSPGTMPEPDAGETAVEYADRLGHWYTNQLTSEEKKRWGVYLTPVPIARFMARSIHADARTIRVLDPDAGTGILACAAAEFLAASESGVRRIDIEAHEIDPRMKPLLEKVFSHLAKQMRGGRISISTRVETGDFILKHSHALVADGRPLAQGVNEHGFDVVIANPPYFKLPKSDPRVQAASRVVHGQPNIYALFMAVSAALLSRNGQLIFITPRSFSAGPYFRLFREWFFNAVRPESIHVFDSRREAFRRADVLQENIILVGRRDDGWSRRPGGHKLEISSGSGVAALERPRRRTIALTLALDMSSKHKILRIPTSKADDDVSRLVSSWPETLRSLGLEISTGPVVPFRATSLLDQVGVVGATHAPLLWMNHVHAMELRWPNGTTKPQFIKRTTASEALLVPDATYVLVRRFSAKEEKRRLIAAPLVAGSLRAPAIGIENHLNYVHRPGGTLTEHEALGLAALFNSELLDIYFRTSNGNTQVSATELRAMPLPQLLDIRALGRRVKRARGSGAIDQLVVACIAGVATG